MASAPDSAAVEEIQPNVVAIDLESVQDAVAATADGTSVVLRCPNPRCGAMFSRASALVEGVWQCEFCGCGVGLPAGTDATSVAGGADAVGLAATAGAGTATDPAAGAFAAEFALSGGVAADGEAEAVAEADAAAAKTGAVFVCDLSASMRSERTGMSRIDALRAAVKSHARRLERERPEARVALITFSSKVDLHGASEARPVDASLLDDTEALLACGRAHARGHALPPGAGAAVVDIVLDRAEARGVTALGPAVACGVGMAGVMGAGTRVVVVTDGEANVGVGSLRGMRGPGDESGALFYADIGRVAAEAGVAIDIIGLRGSGTGLETIGDMAALSNGEVRVTDPRGLDAAMGEVVSARVLAINAEVCAVAGSELAFEEAELDGWTATVGNEADAAGRGGEDGDAAAPGADGRPVGGPVYCRRPVPLPDGPSFVGDGSGSHRVVTGVMVSPPRLRAAGPADMAGGSAGAGSEGLAGGGGAGVPPGGAAGAPSEGGSAAPTLRGAAGAPSDGGSAAPILRGADGPSRVSRHVGTVAAGSELTLTFAGRPHPLPAGKETVPFQTQLWFARPDQPDRRLLRVVTRLCPVASDLASALAPGSVVPEVMAAFARARAARLAAVGDYRQSRVVSHAYGRFLAQVGAAQAPEADLPGAEGGMSWRGPEAVDDGDDGDEPGAEGGAGVPGEGAWGPSGATPSVRVARQFAASVSGLDTALSQELRSEARAREASASPPGRGRGTPTGDAARVFTGRGPQRRRGDTMGAGHALGAGPFATALAGGAASPGGQQPAALGPMGLGLMSAPSLRTPTWASSPGPQSAEQLERSARRGGNDDLSSLVQNSMRRGTTSRLFSRHR